MNEEKNLQEEQSTDNSQQPLVEKENTQSVPDPQPETINQKTEIEKMEVHHHGHVHEKKKWKEYLFQFLMLFPAVFLGFLAEY